MSKPIAVIAGDIHYNLNNLAVADKGTRMAIDKANELGIPFIANGDTWDQKANLRAECVNAMIETFKTAIIPPYINIGNHCKIHAKSIDHSLNFLRPYAHVIDEPTYVKELQSHIIPYQDDPAKLKKYLASLPAGSRLIAHQGVTGSNMGDYILDHSAINKEVLASFRTILSHYHQRQDIECGPLSDNNVGLATYIGSLYTTSFGEAQDLPKGFQVLYDDGSLEFIPTNLRKHRIIEIDLNSPNAKASMGRVDDILWFKIKGTQEQLAKFNKQSFKEQNPHFANFKLELILDEQASDKTVEPVSQTKGQVLDGLIDSLTNTTVIQKQRLKTLWKGFV